jgi:hypothetical protein
LLTLLTRNLGIKDDGANPIAVTANVNSRINCIINAAGGRVADVVQWGADAEGGLEQSGQQRQIKKVLES